jgi:hypothetical protein
MRRLFEPNIRDIGLPPGPTKCDAVLSATKDTKAALDARPVDAYISANRTCETGPLQATGRPHRSLVFLLEELTRPQRPSRQDEAQRPRPRSHHSGHAKWSQA